MLRANETRTVRVKIAALQAVTTAEGQAVPQLPGMRVVEIERGSPLYQRIQGLVVAGVDRGNACVAGRLPAGRHPVCGEWPTYPHRRRIRRHTKERRARLHCKCAAGRLQSVDCRSLIRAQAHGLHERVTPKY